MENRDPIDISTNTESCVLPVVQGWKCKNRRINSVS